MRLEFESNASTIPLVENQTVNEAAPSEGEQLLRAGVKAAQEGRRSEAKALLLRVTEVEPENENAWLWLASISEYPEELLVFLNNVLRVNPENARAIEWKKATRSLLAKTLIQRGVDASREERKHFARQCFEQAVEHDSENELAWLWLASVSDSDAERARMFEKVLEINPDNETALAAVRSFHDDRAVEVLQEAVAEAVEGHHSTASQMLAIVLDENDSLEDAWVLKAHLSTSFEERAEALLKITNLNPENEMARACLASWRALSESAQTRNAGSHQVEESEAAAVAFAPKPEAEEPAAIAESFESEFPANIPEQFDEAPADSFDEAHADPHGFEARGESMTVSHDDGVGEYTEPVVGNVDGSNGYASPDSPTQDLNSIPGFKYEPEQVAFESSPEPVGFSRDENEEQAMPLLSEEVEAEESEMSAAFDIHATSTPEREPDLYIPMASDPNLDPFAAHGETEFAGDRDEEWKNTSPDVFFGYAPENPETSDVPQLALNEPQGYDAPAEAVSSEEAAAEPEELRAAEPVAFEAPISEDAPHDFGQDPTDSFSVEEAPRAEIKDLALCPFCNFENERQVLACGSCRAVLSLTDLESVFNHNGVNSEILVQAVASFEREHESYGLSAEKLAELGLGHVNLGNFRQGYLYLQDAVRANPSNVVLDAQVNAFAIRLAEMEKQQTAQESKSKNRKILVVDDSPTVRKLISSKLEKCGHEVICAIDGLDALEKLNGLAPDLILLDITMPRMDGYQVCKLIRNNADMKDVPVVMISGKDGFFDKVRGRMAGTTDYITKPFGPETLMKTVDNYLG